MLKEKQENIKHCTCPHKKQDEVYGKKMRVFNPTTKHPNNSGGWRCTVCKSVKPK